MWYCDEVHDFCGKRSGFNKDQIEEFSKKRFEQMITDNNRYFNAVQKLYGGLYDRPELNVDTVKQILNDPGYNDAQKYVLRLYTSLNKDNISLLPEDKINECYFLPVLNDLYNSKYNIDDIEQNYDIIPDLRKSENSLNLNKARKNYITSDTIAHHITKTIRELFFKIINISFNDLLGCKYEFDFYTASLLSNNLLNLLSGDRPHLNESAELYLNIDPTGTGASLSALYYTIWKYTNKDCYEELYKNDEVKKKMDKLDEINDELNKNSEIKKKFNEINKINDELILSEIGNNVKLFITYANRWDASNDDELTSIAKKKINAYDIIFTTEKELNVKFQITFGTNDLFLAYQFTLDETGKTHLRIAHFCGTKLSDISIQNGIKQGEGSVLNLANKMKPLQNADYSYTVYKTCGDFLQFFTLKLYERAAIYESKIKEESINNLYVKLSDPQYSAHILQIHNQINILKHQKDKLYTMLSQDLTGMDIGSLFVFNMVGCMHSGDKLKGLNLFLSDKILKFAEEELKGEWGKLILNVAKPDMSRTLLQQDNWVPNFSWNSFGKYKYKKSKSKKQKPKSKNTSKKLEKLKKEALKMGLSKSSLKQGIAKLQKSVTKLKSLAKKYRLKINKKLITNIKKCIKIHDKAKKLKIKLTKTSKSGKRLYKTPSELLKEIKSKMKQNRKKLNIPKKN